MVGVGERVKNFSVGEIVVRRDKPEERLIYDPQTILRRKTVSLWSHCGQR